jgi:hypothetical protein
MFPKKHGQGSHTRFSAPAVCLEAEAPSARDGIPPSVGEPGAAAPPGRAAVQPVALASGFLPAGAQAVGPDAVAVPAREQRKVRRAAAAAFW